MRIVALSDTHGQHGHIAVPPGDVLIHAGDLTLHGELEELSAVGAWLASLPHRHKLVVAGNHDLCFMLDPTACCELLPDAIVLEDAACEIDGVRFYGTPWHDYPTGWAFALPRGPLLRRKWLQIPRGTDVLITHGPPAGVMDWTNGGISLGCADLRAAVEELAPALHLFGHVHERAGVATGGTTTFVNAAILDERYELARAPVVLDVTLGERRGWRHVAVEVAPPLPTQSAFDW